jgi:hypothetical protein
MKNQMLPGIALTIAIAAAVAAAARHPRRPGNGRAGAVSGAAAAGRPPPRLVLAGETAPGPVTPEDREPHPPPLRLPPCIARREMRPETSSRAPRRGRALRPGRRSMYFTSSTPMAAMLSAPSAMASAGTKNKSATGGRAPRSRFHPGGLPGSRSQWQESGSCRNSWRRAS